MAGYRIPNPLQAISEAIDDGTMCRLRSPLPGPIGFLLTAFQSTGCIAQSISKLLAEKKSVAPGGMKSPVEPPSDASQSKEEKLGKILLGTAYTKMSQDYLKYYTDGPTSATTFGGYHPGIDYSAPTGTTVFSPVKGIVAAKYEPKYGQLAVKIEGSRDYFIFIHLSEPIAAEGDEVDIGDEIGKSGNTSPNWVPPHLHVELRADKKTGTWYFSSATDTGANKNPISVLP